MSLPTEFKAVVYTGKLDPLVETKTVKRDLNVLVPGNNELLVRVHSGALNPTDYKHFLANWGSKGCTVGSDLSGIVVKVGNYTKHNNHSLFKIGDYVASFVHGDYNEKPNSGAFQEYVIVPMITTIKFNNPLKNIQISNNLTNLNSNSIINTFESASSLPLGLSTIGMSLHHNFKLNENDKILNSNNWILIWGGTTATGFLAIQIAKKLYNLKVITTANKLKYNDLLLNLGADYVIDYKDNERINKIKDLSNNNIKYSLDCVSSIETYNDCYSCLRLGDSYLDNLLSLQPNILKNGQDSNKNVKFCTTLVYLVSGEDQNLNGTIIKTTDLIVNDHIHYWSNIQQLINSNQIVHAPLTILPNGLDSVNYGLKQLSDGIVSCHKLVFTIQN